MFQTFYFFSVWKQKFSKKYVENKSKCGFLILAFSSIFVQLKVTCLVTLFDRKLQVFKNSPVIDHFWSIFVHSKCKRSSLHSQCWMRFFSVIFKHRVNIFWLHSAPKFCSTPRDFLENMQNWWISFVHISLLCG